MLRSISSDTVASIPISMEENHGVEELQAKYGYYFAPGELRQLYEEFNKFLNEGDGKQDRISLSDAGNILVKLGFFTESQMRGDFLSEILNDISNTIPVVVSILGFQSAPHRRESGSQLFAMLNAGGRQLESAVHMADQDAWNEMFSLECDKSTDTLELQFFEFSLPDKTRSLGSFTTTRSVFGTLSLPLQPTEEWKMLNASQGQRAEASDRVQVKVHVDSKEAREAVDGEMQLAFSDLVRVIFHFRSEGMNPQVHKRQKFPFDPDSTAKQTWDLLVMALLLYTTFAVPITLAFSSDSISGQLSPYQIWDLCLDVVFCTDVLISFCTAYTHQGIYVTNLRSIAQNYLKGWFWIDLPGSVPFDKIVSAVASSENFGSTLKVLKFIRILKMVRAVRFLNKLSQLEEKDRSGSLRTILKTFRSIFLMLFSAHFLGCMFIMLISSDSKDNWLSAYDEELAQSQSRDIEKYVVSLYWALTTVSTLGYGDVLPVNHDERIYTVCTILIGVVVFAFSLGNITTLMTQSEGARLHFEDRLRAISEYLDFRDIKPTLKRRITAHFGGCWRQSGSLFHEGRVLDSFPRQLRQMTLEHLTILAEKLVPVLFGLDHETIGEVFIRLRPTAFMKDEYIYHRGERGGELYFVTDGIVSLAHGIQPVIAFDRSIFRPEENTRLRMVEKGGEDSYFGETSFFSSICEIRAEDARAATDVSCLMLSEDTYGELELACPTFCEKLYELCSLRAAKFGLSNQTVKAHKSGKHKEFGQIDRLLKSLRSELMVRYDELLAQHLPGQQGADDVSSGKEPAVNGSATPSVCSWSVRKKLNMFETAVRHLEYDSQSECLTSRVPSDQSRSQHGSFSGSKTFMLRQIQELETVGNDSNKVRIIFNHGLHPYELEFMSSEELSSFLAAVGEGLHNQQLRKKSLASVQSVQVVEEGIIRGWLAASLEGPMSRLPVEQESDLWRKASFVVDEERTLLCVCDTRTSLSLGRPQVLGRVVGKAHLLSIGRDQGFIHGTHACRLLLDQEGEQRFIFIGAEKKEDAKDLALRLHGEDKATSPLHSAHSHEALHANNGDRRNSRVKFLNGDEEETKVQSGMGGKREPMREDGNSLSELVKLLQEQEDRRQRDHEEVMRPVSASSDAAADVATHQEGRDPTQQDLRSQMKEWGGNP